MTETTHMFRSFEIAQNCLKQRANQCLFDGAIVDSSWVMTTRWKYRYQEIHETLTESSDLVTLFRLVEDHPSINAKYTR
jgi:hypothetical protein